MPHLIAVAGPRAGVPAFARADLSRAVNAYLYPSRLTHRMRRARTNHLQCSRQDGNHALPLRIHALPFFWGHQSHALPPSVFSQFPTRFHALPHGSHALPGSAPALLAGTLTSGPLAVRPTLRKPRGITTRMDGWTATGGACRTGPRY